MTEKSTKIIIYTVFLDFMDSFSRKDSKDGNTVKVIKSGS